MIKSCKGCTKRYLGCHDHCEKYQSELAEVLEAKRKMREEKIKDYPMMKIRIDSQTRALKKKAR